MKQQKEKIKYNQSPIEWRDLIVIYAWSILSSLSFRLRFYLPARNFLSVEFQIAATSQADGFKWTVSLREMLELNGSTKFPHLHSTSTLRVAA